MTPPKLIGLCGKARSGKDTVASYLWRSYRYDIHSFAAPIREFVARILGLTLAQLEQVKEQPVDWLGGVTPRRMMQTAGTEWGRNLDSGLWIKSAMRRAAASENPVVITDCRFDNEAEAVLEQGGEVWRIERPGAGTAEQHVSEAGIRDSLVTRTIHNDGPLPVLHGRVEAALRYRSV